MRLWDPEQTIEPSTALLLIQEQFPELGAEGIRFLGKGWDNTVFVVDDKLIFRFPRRAIALPLLEAEWQLLPKVAPYLPLPIPCPKWKGSPSQAFPWLFVGYQMIPGTSACHANLSEEERSALAEPIARFLAALHGIPLSLLADCHIEGDNLGRLNPAQLIPKIRPLFKELATLGLLKNEALLTALRMIPACFERGSGHWLRSQTIFGDFCFANLNASLRLVFAVARHRLNRLKCFPSIHQSAEDSVFTI